MFWRLRHGLGDHAVSLRLRLAAPRAPLRLRLLEWGFLLALHKHVSSLGRAYDSSFLERGAGFPLRPRVAPDQARIKEEADANRQRYDAEGRRHQGVGLRTRDQHEGNGVANGDAG